MRKPEGELRIYSWNVNGIRAVVKKGFLDWYSAVRPDIMCFQETRASMDGFPAELLQDDHSRVVLASAEKKGYSGVSIVTRIKPENIYIGMGESRFDSEGRVISADYGHFILHSVYFPNGNSSPERLRYKMDFYEFFLQKISAELALGRQVIVCGDVNTAHKEIDLARPKENSKVSGFLPEEREWIDRLVDAGFDDTFRMFNKEPEKYTWWDQKTRARERNVGWRIDYFFTSRGLAGSIENCSIHPEVMGSDHCPVSLTLRI